MDEPRLPTTDVAHHPCSKCGASLAFQPGSTVLKCPYCGSETPIAPPSERVSEIDYLLELSQARPVRQETESVVHCTTCSAEYSVPPDEVTHRCPFCGSQVTVETTPEARIEPNGLLPFLLTSAQSRDKLRKWLGSRFWAPNDLQKMALQEGAMRGMYIPFWTFDTETATRYTGMRGTHYYVPETYTTMVNGRSVTRTRMARRTAWTPATGTVFVPFDDVLVLGSEAIPEKFGQRLQEWDLNSVVPYDTSYLVGFQTMRYSVDLVQGFARAQEAMAPRIDSAIRTDIGGDAQRIISSDTEYNSITFKQLLLPIWVSAYRYRGRSFRVLVNGRTGEVQGEAPVSFWKVLIAVLLGLSVIGMIAYFFYHNPEAMDVLSQFLGYAFGSVPK